MKEAEIEKYLSKNEEKLLNKCKTIKVQLTREWIKQFPQNAGVYVFRENNKISYFGETGNIKGRMSDILNTQNHTIRRNIGETNFSEHPNYQKASSKRKFPIDIENLVNKWIESQMTVSFLPLSLGRKELEERLCEKFNPKYNLKGKRGSKIKTYSKKEKQREHRMAYEPWTNIDDENLEILFCEGKTIKELSKIFERNDGAIRSRIKKLELREKYKI
ncbi:GIY-YIG nuclease family protein [Marinifilum fragile]|uniref:GIY-YIG nuclease family protein n=1 Tax=Marinifilum fragile TaxID=570161 RepID=UPI002AABBD35|nr:hypothetical protein [Marinifilum fragile]